VQNISGYSYNDDQTRLTISKVADDFNYQVCPHTAVGILAAQEWSEKNVDDVVITLATAHPAKFLDTMELALGVGSIEIPSRLACLADIPKVATQMEPDEQALKDWIVNVLNA